ncbi:hypothetical protein CLF_106179 [Clonorchis sinensis]|uniref:Secreted protein n=1 Tax=Clonorchis sinensis TaxID=79923 RepID=G7YPS0_CLOSI|nr:hypothetical protein CLF_106179 [Clonorchis sinensis]
MTFLFTLKVWGELTKVTRALVILALTSSATEYSSLKHPPISQPELHTVYADKYDVALFTYSFKIFPTPVREKTRGEANFSTRFSTLFTLACRTVSATENTNSVPKNEAAVRDLFRKKSSVVAKGVPPNIAKDFVTASEFCMMVSTCYNRVHGNVQTERANVFTLERCDWCARPIERRPSNCPGFDDRLTRQSGLPSQRVNRSSKPGQLLGRRSMGRAHQSHRSSVNTFACSDVKIQMRPTCVGGVVITRSPRMSDVRGSNPGTATGYALLMSSNKSETRVQCFSLVWSHRNNYARTGGRPFKREWCEYEQKTSE